MTIGLFYNHIAQRETFSQAVMSTKETSFLDSFTKTVFGCLHSIIFGFTTKSDFQFKPLLSFLPTLASLRLRGFMGKKQATKRSDLTNSKTKQTKMSKKPTTNEKLQFALTHTPTPQSCQIEISRHSWTPPHGLRLPPPKTTALNGTF